MPRYKSYGPGKWELINGESVEKQTVSSPPSAPKKKTKSNTSAIRKAIKKTMSSKTKKGKK